MTLIRCGECGGTVSDRAAACPHCGCPVERSSQPVDTTAGSAGTTTSTSRRSGDDLTVTAESSAADTEVASSGPLSAIASDAFGQERHVFVSYASEDRDRARLVAEALERRGWPVWWDRDIQAGQAFRSVIEQALERAACVVVLWTERSVASEWVQEEAQVAKARRILVPVLVDDVRQPLGFGQVQAAHLSGWDGAPDAAELDELLRGVCHLMGDDEIPALLDDEEWSAVVESSRRRRGLAREARAEAERSAAEAAAVAAEGAQAEREAAALAGHPEAEADAARRAADLEQAADVARRAAEQREAMLALELAEEHAAELRAIAARRTAREAEARAAEEAATAASESAARTAELREAAAADQRAAVELAAGRAPEIEARARTIATEAARAESSWFRFPREGVATLLGGVLVVISAFTIWLESGITGMDLPLEVVTDATAIDGGGFGLALVITGSAAAVLALFRIPRWITAVVGVAVLVVTVSVLVQQLRFLIDDDRPDDFFRVVRIGPAVALLGGALMSSGR